MGRRWLGTDETDWIQGWWLIYPPRNARQDVVGGERDAQVD